MPGISHLGENILACSNSRYVCGCMSAHNHPVSSRLPFLSCCSLATCLQAASPCPPLFPLLYLRGDQTLLKASPCNCSVHAEPFSLSVAYNTIQFLSTAFPVCSHLSSHSYLTSVKKREREVHLFLKLNAAYLIHDLDFLWLSYTVQRQNAIFKTLRVCEGFSSLSQYPMCKHINWQLVLAVNAPAPKQTWQV